MLEGIGQGRDRLRLDEKLGCLEASEAVLERGLRQRRDSVEERDGHVWANDGSGLEEALVGGQQPVNASGQHGLNGVGDRLIRGLAAALEYNTDLFHDTTITRLLGSASAWNVALRGSGIAKVII